MSRARSYLARLAIWLGCFASLMFAACGSNQNQNSDGGADGCQGSGQQSLSVVGDPNRILHPGGETELQVMLLAKCVGVVPNVAVTFEITNNTAECSLSQPTASTGGQGTASVILKAGSKTGHVQVVAYTESDPEGVAFGIDLKKAIVELRAVGSNSLEAYVNESIELTTRLNDTETSDPVRGVSIGYSILNPPAQGDARLQAAQAMTNSKGLATAKFLTGTMVAKYEVVAQGASQQLNSISFSVNVNPRKPCSKPEDCLPGYSCVDSTCRHNQQTTCQNSDECPDGFECKSSVCQPQGGLPDNCSQSPDCPLGYFCDFHQCFPCNQASAGDPNCQGGSQCVDDEDCPPGFHCINGVCYPDNPQNVVIPELGGRWYTRHFFNLSSAMPDTSSSINEILNTLNQIISYCQITGNQMIDQILCDVMSEYIPPWVPTLLDIFTNFSMILSEMRTEGDMVLTHLNPREILSGTETWNKVLVRYLNACCQGDGPFCTVQSDCDPGFRCINEGCCNPYQQPGYPDCAVIDISRDQLEYGNVGITVEPFTGKVLVDANGINPPTLLIDPRQVQIEYSKFVVLVLNVMIQIFTPYEDLEEALYYMIDCESVQSFVDDLWFELGLDVLGPAPDVVPGCEALKPHAGDLLEALLNQIGVGWKALRYSGTATITTDGDPPYGIKLGTDNYEESSDGKWQGTFQIVLESPITGSWHGER